MLKYPWEQEIDEFEARERAVEQSYKTAAETRAEETGKYGLEYWIYFQAIRALIGIFLLISLLATPKITFVLQGSAIQQNDLFAWIARVSLGNVDLGTKLRLGLLDLTLESPVLGILDVLQFVGPLAFILWFRFFRIPWLVQNPELRILSASDYAVQVDGLPPRLPDEQANQKYDFELLRHFEAVLRELKGADASSFVCEAALARDFSGALLAAQERSRAEARLRQLQESAKAAPGREQRLRQSMEALTREIASKRREEGDRPVWRAFLVLASEEDRRRLLRAYRLAALPLCGRWLQPKPLRLEGRWPLRLAPAPDPGDIVWAHCRSSLAARLLRRAATVPALLLPPAACTGLSLLAWWALLGTRGAAAAQCSPAGGLSDALAGCLLPQGSDSASAAEPGCDCVCLGPPQWRTDPGQCRSLGAAEATVAVTVCWLVAEGSHVALSYVVPPLVDRWRTVLASDIERGKLVTLAVTRALVPLAASIALLAQKALLVQNRPAGLADPLVWEVDRGWYLHAAPVAALWCLGRWIGPVASAIGTCCRPGYSLLLWERWASLISVVAVSVMLQPLVPYLAPLATLGLVVRYWAEKRLFLRGHFAVRSRTPSVIAVRLVRTAFAVLWLSVAAGAALAAWAQATSHGLSLKGSALPNVCLSCLLLAVLVVSPLAPSCPRARRRGHGAKANMNFQEAWLIMKHSDTLASYQLCEHPDYRGGALLKELQPDVLSMGRSGQPVASHWNRNLEKGLDMLPSLALVGDKAPTRGGKSK